VLDLRLNQGFLGGFVAAIGLHLAVFSLPLRQAQVSPTTSPTTKVVLLRSSTSAPDAQSDGQTLARGVGISPSPSVDTPSGRRETQAGQTAMSRMPRPMPVPPSSPFSVFTSRVLAEADYFDRDQLTVGPSPKAEVLIDYPPVDGLSGSHMSELSLFIDEGGRVVRVRVDGPDLPAALEEAARTAFLAAQFSPGQVDGLPVRSRLRVEVSFVATPTAR
jgi:hypothetical protein